MAIQAFCSGACQQSVNPANIVVPTLTGPTADLCESSGGFAKGAYQYTPKATPSKLNILTGNTLATNWDKQGGISCNLSSTPEPCIHCKFFPGSTWSTFGRVYSNLGVVVDPSPYTHFELEIKAAPGFGEVQMGTLFYNKSYAEITGWGSVRISNPFYSGRGPISELDWKYFRIPKADLGLTAYLDIVGFAFYPIGDRPIEVYIRNIAFAAFDTQLVAIPGFPSAPLLPPLVGPGRPTDTYPTTPITTPKSTPSISTPGVIGCAAKLHFTILCAALLTLLL